MITANPKPVRLLICGAAGFTNLGDDAILWGMLAQLRQALPAAHVCVAGGPELATVARPFGAIPLSYDEREELARAIEDADLVVLGGGGMLYDVGYHATLARFLTDPPDRQWLYELSRVAAAGQAAGKPVMCYAIGCGPLLTTAAREMAAFLARQCAAITVRDQASADALVSCGIPAARVHVAADPAVMVEADEEAGARWASELGLEQWPRPWVGINLRPWHFGDRPEDEADFVTRAAELVRGIRSRLGGTAILFPFQRLYDDDSALAARVVAAAKEGGAVVAQPPVWPPALLAALSRLDLAVGMRMHFLLLTAAAGVPFVALSYARKVEEVARAIGLDHQAHRIEDFQPGAVLDACESLLARRDELRPRLATAVRQLREAAEISPALLTELVTATRESRAPRPAGRSLARVKPRTKGMRVLMWTRPDYREKPGGDVVQLEQLLPYLREAGVQVELTGEPAPDLSQFDLIHTINLDRPEDPYRHSLCALRAGKPVVVSPVHTDMSEFLEWGNPDYWELPEPGAGSPVPRPAPLPHPLERRRRALSHLQRQAVIQWATVCLPNSQIDADYLTAAFAMDQARSVVVHHGIAPIFFEARPEPFVERYGLRDFVICAARVEARKNQLLLVAALRGTGIPLVIVGQPNPEEYRELCRRYADENVLFLDAMPQSELASAFAAARVHALPSWFEVPGLVSLEAGAAGCQVVSTDRGSAREYLGDDAWYCDPRSVTSIREAVLSAYEAPRTGRLRERLARRFTWERAAQQTLEGYQLALALWEAEQAAKAPQPTYLRALEAHADWLARRVADLEFEARSLHAELAEARGHIAHLEAWARQWQEHSQAVEAELQRWQEEMRRITQRRLFRWSEAVARAAWGVLKKLGVKP